MKKKVSIFLSILMIISVCAQVYADESGRELLRIDFDGYSVLSDFYDDEAYIDYDNVDGTEYAYVKDLQTNEVLEEYELTVTSSTEENGDGIMLADETYEEHLVFAKTFYPLSTQLNSMRMKATIHANVLYEYHSGIKYTYFRNVDYKNHTLNTSATIFELEDKGTTAVISSDKKSCSVGVSGTLVAEAEVAGEFGIPVSQLTGLGFSAETTLRYVRAYGKTVKITISDGAYEN